MYVDTSVSKPAAVVAPADAAFQFWIMVPGSAPFGSDVGGSDHTSFHTTAVRFRADTDAWAVRNQHHSTS